MLGSCSPATLRDAMRRLLPCPPASRYTAVSMLPRAPGLLHRAGAALASLWMGTRGSGGMGGGAGGGMGGAGLPGAAGVQGPGLGLEEGTVGGVAAVGSGLAVAAVVVAVAGAGLMLYGRARARS